MGANYCYFMEFYNNIIARYLPSPSLSNRLKASLNSAICSSVSCSTILIYRITVKHMKTLQTFQETIWQQMINIRDPCNNPMPMSHKWSRSIEFGSESPHSPKKNSPTHTSQCRNIPQETHAIQQISPHMSYLTQTHR